MGKIDYSIIGQRFGKLTVVEYEYTGKRGSSYWLCQCDCGNQITVRRDSLMSGDRKSCGCMIHERARTRLLGNRFGRLTVIEFDHISSSSITYWLCECDCGNTVVVAANNLQSGNTTSCGCYHKECTAEQHTKHGMSNSRLYRIWAAMIKRCDNKNSSNYAYYGGKGVRVCEAWYEFECFYNWAMKNGYADDLSIDRIDSNGDYTPENCRWADVYVQRNNTSKNRYITYLGETHTLGDWARILDTHYDKLYYDITHNNISDFADYFGIIDPNWHEG